MRILSALLLAAGVAATAAPATAAPTSRLTLVEGDHEPPGARAIDAAELTRLRDAVTADPGDRAARFALVRALERAGQLDEAITAARAWRAADAYNLVVVRLLGDLYAEKGDRAQARRTYSAVVELLPRDAGAQRALASALKQAGDIQAAYDRLAAATELAPTDRRLAFELADAAYRLDRLPEARERFEAIVADTTTPQAVAYPARQRLAQIYHQLARTAAAGGDAAEAAHLEQQIEELGLAGGTENDLKIYLTWDTDRSDVDLWVTNPSGEKVFYDHKNGAFGDALYDDITTGYGPESYTAPHAAPGTYLVQVNYYGVGRGNLSEARGEVVVVLDEGKPTETRHVIPYRLFDQKDTVTVARIDVR
ncbi:MAG TPA: tetratricopeptide repeat protein [Kofleriaceae bacterium]|nr:tetratricopeptide repeat protein [Kofleriaceae bacterium]